MIPARYSASRFPGKLMQDLGGKTVIMQTYNATVATNLFDDVFVVDAVYFFFIAFFSHQNDFFFGSPLGKAAGQGKGLQHRQVLDQRILTGALDFP